MLVKKIYTLLSLPNVYQNVKCCLQYRRNWASRYVPSFKETHSYQYCTVAGSRVQELNNISSKELLEKYDTILLDCDGVLWKTDHVTPLPGIAETMNRLRKMGKQILFVTNNSMHDRDMYVRKFKEYGFEATDSEVFCVAYAAAIYLKNVAKITKAVYVSGSPGMQSELEKAGISFFGIGPDPDESTGAVEKLLKVKLRDDVEAVLVGFDYHFNYSKMFKAASYLTNPDCLYFATNSLETGAMIAPNRRQPVTGANVAAISAASKRNPMVLGKPYFHMFECIKAMYPDINKSRTVMIGDSLQADIQFAKNNGIDSVLVLTGMSDFQTVKDTGIEPTYFLQSLADLL